MVNISPGFFVRTNSASCLSAIVSNMSHPRAMRAQMVRNTFQSLTMPMSMLVLLTTSIAVATTSISIIWSIYTWRKLRTMKYHPLPHSSRQAAYRASSRLSFSFRNPICETIRAHQRRMRVVTMICESHLSELTNDMTAISMNPKPQNTSTIELSRIRREKRNRRM